MPDRRSATPHNPVWSRLATRALQRSPLSDLVKDAFKTDPTLDGLLARLSQADVQSAQGDLDVDAEIGRLLAGRPDDLWVAQRIRQGKLGDTTGQFGPLDPKGMPIPRPIPAFFFKGISAQRALVIAGVHGTERQGIEVAEMLVKDLGTKTPYYTTIVVPSLFPDNAASGTRETGKGDDRPTNRNFPNPNEDLAAATAAGGGTPVDASRKGGKRTRAIQPENVMLLQVLERFKPERIISIHGTHRSGAGGVFYDPRPLTPAEIAQTKKEAADMADFLEPGWRERADSAEILERYTQQALQFRGKYDEDLSRRAAIQIDNDTKGLANRDRRAFNNREDDPTDPADPKKKIITPAENKNRKAHPSIAGNIGKSGKIDRFSWSGSGTGGVSLGGYAPPRGMSVFTVEPPVNANTADYAASGFKLDQVSAADRKKELQSYADAVRTVLLGR